MRWLLTISLLCLTMGTASAAEDGLTTPPAGSNDRQVRWKWLGRPAVAAGIGAGDFGRYGGNLWVGGRATAPSKGRLHWSLGTAYSRSDCGQDPPQPNNQTAHNAEWSQSYNGHLIYASEKHGGFNVQVRSGSGRIDVPNRTGLPASFAPYGQGYGFGGRLSAGAGIPSQDAAGQRIALRRATDAGGIQWRGPLSGFDAVLQLDIARATTRLFHGDPAPALQALPMDSAIEFSPTIRGDYSRALASVVLRPQRRGSYWPEITLRDEERSASSSFQLMPASQLALNALAYRDQRLAPVGAPRVDGTGAPVLDVLGHPVYDVAPGATAAPTVLLRHTAFYRTGEADYRWSPFDRGLAGSSRSLGFLAKIEPRYGVRAHWYGQSAGAGRPQAERVVISPVASLRYPTGKGAFLTVSYERTLDPLWSYTTVLLEQPAPERADQYVARYERSIGSGKAALGYTHRLVRDRNAIAPLIPTTQIGAETAISFERAVSNALEVSYEVRRRARRGWGAELRYRYATEKLGGWDSTGSPAPRYNPLDERHSAHLSLERTWATRLGARISMHYGSGIAASAYATGLPRHGVTTVDTALTVPAPFAGATVRLDVRNLFDSHQVLRYNSHYTAAAFMRGREVMVATNYSF